MNKKKLAAGLLKLARELIVAYEGKGAIKFVIDDLVRIGTGRNVWKVTDVRLEYPLYDPDYVGTVRHLDLGRTWEPVGWKATRRPGVDKKGYGKRDDTILVKRGMGRLEEGKEYKVGYPFERYAGEGVNTKKRLTNGEPQYLEPAEAEPMDKDGRNAVDAFNNEFGGKGKMVVINPNRTQAEQVGKVLAIGKKGSVRLQIYGRHAAPQRLHDQETFVPDFSDKMEVSTFRPSLFSGRWIWRTRYESITKPYQGRTLTWLLD